MVDKRLSHYKILDEIGRGGMGIVYRAEDTTLHREVALKILPLSALGSDDDKARFLREAQAAAQLHHPNIATVFAIEETETGDGTKQPFIAMELIDGETLTERINRGPLDLDEAVELAVQIAGALEMAHEKNIVHRDVKSGNVMITSRGLAKVLDFGLAKTAQSTKLTQLGSTLGTIAYMSPEQARGDEVDRRSDIWSLGVLIYEMISGRLPFASEYEQAAVYSIMNEDPDPLTAIRTGVPMALELLVGKCLSKNADQRYQSATDLLVDLKSLDLRSKQLSKASGQTVQRPAIPADQEVVATPKKGSLVTATIGVVCFILGALAIIMLRPAAQEPLRKYEIPMPGLTVAAISNDGSQYAYVQHDTLYVQAFSSLARRSLTQTPASFLVWSPDDARLAFAQENELWTIEARGGEPRLARRFDEVTIVGAAWTTDDRILVSARTGASLGQIFSVSPEGGVFEVVRETDAEAGLTSFDLVASEGDITVYQGRNTDYYFSIRLMGDEGDSILIERQDFSPTGLALSDKQHMLVSEAYTGLTAYLLDSRDASLARDPRRLAPPGALSPSVSGDGTLMYVQHEAMDEIITRYSPGGERLGTIGQGGQSLRAPVLHPDRNRAMVTVDTRSLWLMDSRGSGIPMETGYRGLETSNAWLSDGRRIVLSSFRDGVQIYVFDITGRSPRQQITYDNTWAATLSKDERYIAFYGVKEETRRDLFFVELNVTDDSVDVIGDWQTYLQTPADEAVPQIHPEGNLLLYQTNSSGIWQIVVRTFPNPNENFWTVTVDGGLRGRWNPEGDKIYFLTSDHMLWMVPFDKTSSNPVGTPEPQFRLSTDNDPYTIPYDFDPATGDIISISYVREPAPPSLVIVENWANELE